jgi:hypothetical protein
MANVKHSEMREHAAELRDLAQRIKDDGLHGQPGSPLPVDHFGREQIYSDALTKGAELLEDGADLLKGAS